MKAADAESRGTTPLADSQSYPRSGYTATHFTCCRAGSLVPEFT
jgi:hypothetical protein